MPEPQPLHEGEKLLRRLAQLPNRVLSVVIVTGKRGEPLLIAIQENGRLENLTGLDPKLLLEAEKLG